MFAGIVISIALLAAAVCLAPALADVAPRGVPGPQDEQLVLQAAVTKTASFDGAGLLHSGAGWESTNGEHMAAVVDVSALDLASENETYSLVLQESDDDSSYTACGAAKSVTATGQVILDGIVRKPYVRLSLTAGGTTPSITYSAYLNPLI